MSSDAPGAAGTDQWAALLDLGDRLRRLDDPAQMAFVAAEIMGRELEVDRAGYGRFEPGAGTLCVGPDWTAPDVSSLGGDRAFICDGSWRARLEAGETIACPDVLQAAGANPPAGFWAQTDVRAVLNYPILEDGVLMGFFYLHDRRPRDWSAADLRFVQSVADRTRSTIRQRQAETSLRDLAASLERQVAERTADRNLLWRLSSDIMLVSRFDGTMVAANPAWAAVLGWKEHELIGKDYIDFVHPDDVERSRQGGLSLSGGHALRRFDNRYRHKDGSYRWISWAAAASEDLVTGVGRDITADREQEEALARSEALMRSVFATSNQYQGLVTPDGIVLDANPTSLAGIDARLKDVVGKPFWETPWFTGTEGAPDQIKAAFPAVAAGGVFRREVTVRLPTGSRPFDFSMRPALGLRGEVLAVIVEAVELTERRAVEEQLRQAQKMEAVGQLTGGLAHDFNNLLTGISGSLELLKGRFERGRLDGAERYIATALGAAGRASALTQRLLAFSRRQMLEPRPTAANALIAGMTDLIQRTVGPQITLHTALDNTLWLTLCDRHQLEHALLNLCINARDAMPDGGDLTIKTVNSTFDKWDTRAHQMAPGDYVTISVADTGTGMSPEVASRAFDPFFTTKPIGKGTGLGLSMTYGFVKQSGGDVVISSAVGQGATLRIHLPRHTGPAEAPAPMSTPVELLHAEAGECVMVVDDEPSVRVLTTDVLEGLGYAVIVTEEASAALKILRSTQRIDLLVTDVGLPGDMNGRQLADAARLARPGLTVLFITGYAESAAFGSGTLAPGMQVMTKPFAMEAFADKIRAMIGHP
jgi:PAS domain S-box-containing protein